jgi:DNA-binding NarL/FixJ family response regulator
MPYRRNMHGELRLQGKRVLVAEDEPLVAMDIEAMLEDSGAEVVGPAATLAEALELAKVDDLDAAVLDVNLRGEDVRPAAERLAHNGVAIMFHTGHSRPEELSDQFPDAYVCSKPVAPEVLVKAVEALANCSTQH